MDKQRIGLCLGLIAIGLLPALAGCKGTAHRLELLNVSYDPTRELYRDLNEAFAADYAQASGCAWTIKQSHGGSGSQARAVIDGLEADVVTLALPSDTDQLRRKGLLAEGWEQRLPNDSLPFYSTIVFVVRRGNPKGIRDWPDLIQDGVQVITPNPKTSGNGKLSFYAAWGYQIHQGKSAAEAHAFVGKLYSPDRIPVLDQAARGSTVTFAQRNIGDVHLTWENEAHLEVREARGALEIVYPSVSIQAEPKVAWVDGNVDRKGTRQAAEAYLRFLYTEPAQKIIARHYYRPSQADVLARHTATLKPLELFPITAIAQDWDDASKKFFNEGGIFDAIYQPRNR